MQEEQNIRLVKQLYEAFAKGEIDTLIGHLADEFIWRYDAPAVIPFAGEYKNPDQVRYAFFGSLAASVKDQVLSPEEFIAQNDKVVMVGRYRATVKATGKPIDVAVVHVLTIRNGKVTRFLNFNDSARVAEAYQSN